MSQQPKLRIKPESIRPKDRLSEVCYWKVYSNVERDAYTSEDVWDFMQLEDAVEWIRDHPDDDHVLCGADRSNRRVTTWIDLDDVEEVNQ